jgi:hypothetical protein
MADWQLRDGMPQSINREIRLVLRRNPLPLEPDPRE